MFKITNLTEGRIVINGLPAILSPNGTHGDSITIDVLEREVESLVRNGVLSVRIVKKANGKIAKKKREKAVEKEPEVKKIKTKRAKKTRSVVTFVDHGKVKTSKMVQSIEHNGDFPNPLTADDQEFEEVEKDNPAFI